MNLFPFLLSVLGIFLIADVALGASVIYHLRKYTLPGSAAARIAIPLYIALSSVFLLFAIRSLLEAL